MVHARWRCTTCKVDTKKQHCEHFTDTCFQMSYIFQSQSGPKVHNLTQRLRNTHKFLSNFYAYLFPGWSQIVLNTTEKIMPDDAKITTTWEFHVESQEQQGTKVNCQWISVWYIYIYTHMILMYDDVCVHSHRSPRSYFPASSLGRTSVEARTRISRQDLGVYQVLSGKGIKTVLFSLGARGLDRLDHWGPKRCRKTMSHTLW